MNPSLSIPSESLWLAVRRFAPGQTRAAALRRVSGAFKAGFNALLREVKP